MRYLLIENPGVSDISLMTIIGASTARGDESSIGQFGSGFKYSVALLLRNSIGFKLFNGLDGYEFTVHEKKVKDVSGENVYINEVVRKQVTGDGRKTVPMGFDQSFGSVDWKDVTMAIREFFANTLDAVGKQGLPVDSIRMEMVDDPGKLAKAGFTRLYVESTPEIERYFENRAENFLMFQPGGFNTRTKIIEKDESSPMRVYRKGVLVWAGKKNSLFNYNLNDLSLPETRIASEWDVKYYSGYALRDASEDQLYEYFQAMKASVDCFEIMDIEPNYLRDIRNETTKEKWRKAIDRALGVATVFTSNSSESHMIERKGFAALEVEPEMMSILASYGAKTANNTLDTFEKAGREKFIPTNSQVSMCNLVWKKLVQIGMTKGKDVPDIHGFRSIMDGGCTTDGYFDTSTNTIGLSPKVLDGGLTPYFVEVLIEEYGHYITGANDASRDFQSWAFQVAGLLMAELLDVS